MDSFDPTYASYVRSPQETIRLGRSIASKVKAPQVLALFGDLGAGKTTLAKGVISALTQLSPSEVTSPTFQYVHLYSTAEAVPVAHFDLWRLRNSDDFLELGLEEYLSCGIALVEWPERISPLLPNNTIRIQLSICDGGGRLVRVQCLEENHAIVKKSPICLSGR